MVLKDYEEGAVLFLKVAKIVWNEIYNYETTFSGSLIEYESINLSLTSKSMSIILYGTKIKSDIIQSIVSVKCYVCLKKRKQKTNKKTKCSK